MRKYIKGNMSLIEAFDIIDKLLVDFNNLNVSKEDGRLNELDNRLNKFDDKILNIKSDIEELRDYLKSIDDKLLSIVTFNEKQKIINKDIYTQING